MGSRALSHTKAAIYLPRGILNDDEQLDSLNISTLQAVLPYPVVRIEYRRGRGHHFPTPLHDVLAGYDYVVQNMLPKRGFVRSGRSEHVGQLSICGELLGGQLATALALTECRVGEPGISAAIVNNPILDWVDLFDSSLDELEQRESNKPDEVLTVKHLLQERRGIFRKSEHHFDPFASPLLFFRSAGMAVAEEQEEVLAPRDDMEDLIAIERQTHARQSASALDELQDVNMEFVGQMSGITQTSTRKAARRYPSKSLGLRLPQFHVSAGVESEIECQAAELVKNLRKSYHRQGKSSGRLLNGPDDEAMGADDYTEMARFELYEGHGMWDATAEGRSRFLDAARWLEQTTCT